MNIYLDNIIYLLQKGGGISVVWTELLKRLLKTNNLNLNFIDYKTQNIWRNQLNIPSKAIVSPKKKHFAERYKNIEINKKNRFIFHSSYYRYCSNKNAINITTVHDFTYEICKKGLKKMLHSYQKGKALKKSNIIICISENTKKDLIHFYPNIDRTKLRVVYNGVSDDYYLLESLELIEFPFPIYSYIIFVGSRDKYKNFELSARAVAKSKYNLVIVGPSLTYNEKKLLDSIFNGTNKYKSLGRVSNIRLNELYNGAFALLYPSIYEGFGIPVIEAQRAGCPVIAYNASSIPEIIGDVTLLLNELSIDSILKHLVLLENNKTRISIIEKGIQNAKRFTWDKMYIQILSIYQEAWEC
ncbi:glycosyltransferase family 1 protein [uncultured Bacteroides sp.]|uniref:glycosyltransferase family 4 protein n=1 Tax=uncultured Bacteroides sp. TaxID=162156 RepID=UPI002AAAD363|nr:glycosyltransferase family 1 protein [uncultured Bacteroides sp.]